MAAIAAPAFVAFAGRKANALMLPMRPQLVEAETVEAAFAGYEAGCPKDVRELMASRSSKFWASAKSTPIRTACEPEPLTGSKSGATFAKAAPNGASARAEKSCCAMQTPKAAPHDGPPSLARSPAFGSRRRRFEEIRRAHVERDGHCLATASRVSAGLGSAVERLDTVACGNAGD